MQQSMVGGAGSVVTAEGPHRPIGHDRPIYRTLVTLVTLVTATPTCT